MRYLNSSTHRVMFPDIPLLPVLLAADAGHCSCGRASRAVDAKPRFDPSAGRLRYQGRSALPARAGIAVDRQIRNGRRADGQERSAARRTSVAAGHNTVSVSAPTSMTIVPTDCRSAALTTTFSRSTVLNESIVSFNV